MPFDIIIGRNEEDKKKFGDKGLVYLGKQYVQIGQNISMANNVYMDIAKTHQVLIVGKKGSGKSFSASVIAEEISTLPEEVKRNISVLFFDTMGIFWTMKFPNKRQEGLLEKWGMRAESIPIDVYVPEGYYDYYKENKIPADFKFSIRTSELNASDWCEVFEVKLTETIGVALESILLELKDRREDYSITDIIKEIKDNKRFNQEIKNALENRFISADKWGLFGEKGTRIKDIVGPGKVSVLDISIYTNISGNLRIKALVIALISRKILEQRILARKLEEIEEIEYQSEFFKEEKEKDEPMVWLVLDECLPYDSLIKTDKGEIKIGDLVKRIDCGEEIKVRGYNKENDTYNYFKILKTHKIEPRELIKLKTETGRELNCTPDHPILTKNGFISSISAKETAFPLEVDYKSEKKLIIARLAGHILGDGYLSKIKCVGFCGKGNNDLELIKRDLDLIDFKYSSTYERITNSIITDKNENKLNVVGISQEFRSGRPAFYFFKKLGFPIGKKTGIEFNVPEFIQKGTKEEKAEFLAALTASDGSKISKAKNSKIDFNPIRIVFHKNEELEKNGWEYAKQIAILFSDLGINISSIKKIKGNIKKNGNKTIKFTITLAKSVGNTINFLEKVNYRYHSKKELDSRKWLAYLRYYNNLIEKWNKRRNKAVPIFNEGNSSQAEIVRLLHLGSHQRLSWWITHPNQKTRIGKELTDFDTWVNERCQGKVLFEKIKNIEILPKENLFDIEVDQVHNFIANDTIVHNCHEFLPKDEKTAATDALIRVIREGRQPGISLIAISQQPGELVKDVLTQADIILAHRLTAKKDIEALNSIMQTYLYSDLSTHINNLPKARGAGILLDDNSERIYSMQVHPKKSWHGGEAPSSVKEKKQSLIIK
ncbi:MAG: DUF87 domain-containing protein [Nanoarchaeota archaeon]